MKKSEKRATTQSGLSILEQEVPEGGTIGQGKKIEGLNTLEYILFFIFKLY